MSVTPSFPPVDGSITVLPGFLDFHAKHNPSRLVWVFPALDPASSDYGSVTAQEFAEATHRVAHAVRPGRGGPDRAVVAVVVSCDTLLYHALTVGIVRAGLVPFPMSPRNSAPAIANMLQGTDCHRIISQPSFSALTDAVRTLLPADFALQVDDHPALSDVFPQFVPPSAVPVPISTPPPYPSPAEDPGPTDIVLYLHSSGSTGFPKPIPQTRTTILQWTAAPGAIDTRDRGLRWGSPMLPPFHTMGMMMQLYQALVGIEPVAIFHPRAHLGLPPTLPTPENTIDAARRTGCTCIPAVPAFIEAWAHDEDHVKFLASIPMLLFAGGPLSEQNGKKLVDAGVYLCNMYGGTEFGAPVATFDITPTAKYNPAGKTREDWQWIQFSAEPKIRWVPQGDGSYELVFLTCPTHQPSKENLPNGEKGYATSDLWEPHPTKPGLWRIVGRSDDVLVLSNGEKIVPIQQEGHIGAHPWVKGALMFGRGREQPGIIVELDPAHEIQPGDEDALVEFRNAIWPQVEEANQVAPAFARIFKEMIIVADPARPFPRAAKGTVIRRQTTTLYEADIDALYKTVDDSTNAHNIAPPASWSVDDVQTWLSAHVSSLMDGRTLSVSEDLFEQGFNSLTATFLRNRIVGALRASSSPATAQLVQPNFIFSNPTISELAKSVASLVQSGSSSATRPGAPVADIEASIKKYTALLPEAAPLNGRRRSAEDGAVVLITGTTGVLGAHVLATLLSHPAVRHVHALNRGTALLDRQRAAFDAASLATDVLASPKLSLLAGDLSREDFGLDTALLDKLRQSVTHVVHNAWRVDFNLALASFESHISAAVRLACLVPEARFFFTSSVSAAQGWRTQREGPVPETTLGDPAIAIGSGYGTAKFVVEEVLGNARKAGFSTTTLRIGQICGSRKGGIWNTTEWFPILVKSSIALGCLPELDGMISWVPMDAVADTVSDIMLGTHDFPLVNIVHPRPVKSVEVLSVINDDMGGGLPSVSYQEWVKRLKDVNEHASAQDLSNIPALKLLDFFESLVNLDREAPPSETELAGLSLFETANAEKGSPTLRNMSSLNRDDVKGWMRFWKSKQFIS